MDLTCGPRLLFFSQRGPETPKGRTPPVGSGCSSNYTDTEGLKQQTLISHGSGGWKGQDQGDSRFSVRCRAASSFTHGRLLAVSSHGRWGKRMLRGPFMYKGAKALPPHTLTWRVRIQHAHFGRMLPCRSRHLGSPPPFLRARRQFEFPGNSTCLQNAGRDFSSRLPFLHALQ